MTESVTIPEIAQTAPPKKLTGGEVILRSFVLLLGIFLGLVVAFIVALATGWLQIGC